MRQRPCLDGEMRETAGTLHVAEGCDSCTLSWDQIFERRASMPEVFMCPRCKEKVTEEQEYVVGEDKRGLHGRMHFDCAKQSARRLGIAVGGVPRRTEF
jgi:hypothetical protein